jgi:hypothetical protein
MWWVAINHDSFPCALSNTESVAALAALLGWGRTEEEAAETWGQGWGDAQIIRIVMGSIIPIRQRGEQNFSSKISLPPHLFFLFPFPVSLCLPPIYAILLVCCKILPTQVL